MIALQPMRHHQNLSLFHPKLLLHMLEQVLEVVVIRLVRTDVLGDVDGVELDVLQRPC